MAECLEKHTKYQPSDEEWKCPRCGAGAEYEDTTGERKEGLLVEDPVGDDDCSKLHEGDTVYCHKCESGWSGSAIAKKFMVKAHAVTCPTCHGKGWVKGA